MKRLFTLLMVLSAFAINAQVTQVSGNQFGTWSGEVHLIDDVTVPDGETLIIDAGTTVIADGYFGITVLGTIRANGEENARISFTVADTTGYSNYENPELGGWKGFYAQKPNGMKFEYCDFSYGKNQTYADGGMMWICLASDIEIANCCFHHNMTRRKGGALYAENSTLNIHDCEVYDNLAIACPPDYTWGVGFQFLKCNLDIHDVVFHDNNSETAYGGGMNIDSCNLVLTNSIFYNNNVVNAGGLGIQRCKEYTVKVANMLAYNNSVVHYGGGLAVATSDPELNNLTIVNNYCGGGGGAGMQTAFDASPTLNNCIIWGNHAIHVFNEKDTVEYYNGSQIWLWGMDCRPVFKNGDIQYGFDSIYGKEYLTDENYINMIDANPLFVDELNHDYHLVESSPCVNTGVADITGLYIPSFDLGGGPRICGGRIDMGCYEFGYEDVNEIQIAENDISVYPNPLNSSSLCVVNLGRRSEVTLKLITLDGKELYKQACGTLNAGENKIPLEEIVEKLEKKNNLYLLIIDTQEDKYFNKVIY